MMIPQLTGNISTTFSGIDQTCGLEEMVAGCSDLLQSASKLMLGKGDIDLLMQSPAAHNMFNDLSVPTVVWDEELQHMCDDQHGLLKELAQGGCHAGDNKFMFKAPVALNRLVHEVPSQVVWDEEHLQSPNSEDDLLLLLSEPATIAEHVEFIDQVISSGDAQEVFASIRRDREATSLTDEGAFYSCKVSECASVKVFNKMTLPDVVWDQEPQHHPKSHGLLLQIVSGEECLVDMDSKTLEELVNLKLLMATKDSPGELIDEKHCMDVIWDEESHHGIMQQIAQGINDQMHGKHIDFKAFVLSDHDTLNVLSKNHWTDILRSIVEFDVNEALAMGSECLNDEKMIFDANIDALSPPDLLCVSSQFQNHTSCSHNEEMLIYLLYPSVCPRKYYGVQNSVFQSFVSSGRTYSSSLRSQCCGLHHGDMTIALLRRGVFVYSLEKYRFDAGCLLLGNSSPFAGFSQCSNDTRNVLDKVPAWCNNGFSHRANAQLRVPKRRYFHGWYFDQVKEQASETVGECPLFSPGQKCFKQESIWNMSWSYGRVQNCSLSDKFMSGQPEGCSAGALQKAQSLSHVAYGIVDSLIWLRHTTDLVSDKMTIMMGVKESDQTLGVLIVDMHVALPVSNQMYSWSRSGFSPWKFASNKRLLSVHSDRKSDANTMCEFFTPIVEFNFNEKLAMERKCLDGEILLQLGDQHTECPAGEDTYSDAKPSTYIIVMTMKGDAMALLGDMYHNQSNDMWDGEIQHEFGLCDGLLQQLALQRKYRDGVGLVLHGMSPGELCWADMHVGEKKIDGMELFPQIFQLLLLCGATSTEKGHFNLSATNWRVVLNGIIYVAKLFGGKMVTAKCYQSNMVKAHIQSRNHTPLLCITIQQYSSMDDFRGPCRVLTKEICCQSCDAFAWGQAKFQGGGNVTPQMKSKESNVLTGKWVHHPWDPGGRQDQVYILPIHGTGEA